MSDFGIVYCHFNPVGFKKREQNLIQFQESMRRQLHPETKVVSVEVTYLNQQPVSNPTIHIKADEMHLMWQKENLLNIGIKELIRMGCTKVAWLDADIIFLEDNWFRRCNKLLDQYSIIQMFKSVLFMEPELKTGAEEAGFVLQHKKQIEQRKSCSGFAWAARIDSIPELLLDRDIIGGADHRMASSWMGLDPSYKRWEELAGEFYAKSWKEWESKTPIDISKTHFLNSKIIHLYHGEGKHRKYVLRYQIVKDLLKEDSFYKDSSGLWRWSDDSDEIRKAVSKYFISRREDLNPYKFL